ncbi:uncharacterized protein LOC129609727 [Condylostylus longicornis]|uniref:uncharacterized protein LOC129609727 n=1 Tax=Condylostylus longicornis TaxID=2530218 RepID=UPI00244DCCDF|nr:uncharacterized protein LOC129609727 [Condylostylus longicornis]
MESMKEKKIRKTWKKPGAICGVPGCSNYKNKNISTHKIPQDVIKCKNTLKKWSMALKMGKPFPKNFRICSVHFEKRFFRQTGASVRMSNRAFPTLNLPKSLIGMKKLKTSNVERKEKTLKQGKVIEAVLQNSAQDYDPRNESFSIDSSLINHNSTQCEQMETADKSIQTQKFEYIDFSSTWDTSEKLMVMTGIPNFALLDDFIKACCELEATDKSYISMKIRILLTMLKLKTNMTFQQVAISFNISSKTAKLYFSDTIQLLSKVLQPAINFLPTREEYTKNLTTCFTNFPNTAVILDSTEVKSAVFRHLKSKKSFVQVKQFKVLSEKLPLHLLPFINNILTVICGISNLTNLKNCDQ